MPASRTARRRHRMRVFCVVGSTHHDRGDAAAQMGAMKNDSISSNTIVKPRTKVKPKTERPKLYKVILLNDDFTPREFVVLVLKAVFRMNAEHAYHVMMTAHQRGACVIAVYTRDVAETKAKEATELGKQKGFPLYFTTEPEE
jgi:ATP-dependent Clp protease adaptor protein ClpS